MSRCRSCNGSGESGGPGRYCGSCGGDGWCDDDWEDLDDSEDGNSVSNSMDLE